VLVPAFVVLLVGMRIENGQALVPERPGAGIEWDEDRLRSLEVQAVG
jgi:L-alanine-DL-glutamate epimerase-like enolase superfamily enzyme